MAFALAGMLSTTLHEVAHLLTALAFGHRATLYPNAVDLGTVARTDTAVIALAGPSFSLLSGLALIFAGTRLGRGFGRLLWLWCGFLSAQIGFGYLVIAPFARAGDTGQALQLLGAPGYAYVASTVGGVAGMLWLARRFAGQAIRYAEGDQQLRAVGLFAWLTGTGVLLAVYAVAVRTLSAEVLPVVLAGVATIGIFTPMLTFFFRRLHAEREDLSLRAPRWSLAVTVALAVAVAGPLAVGVTVG